MSTSAISYISFFSQFMISSTCCLCNSIRSSSSLKIIPINLLWSVYIYSKFCPYYSSISACFGIVGKSVKFFSNITFGIFTMLLFFWDIVWGYIDSFMNFLVFWIMPDKYWFCGIGKGGLEWTARGLAKDGIP